MISVPAGSQHFQTTVAMTYNGATFNVLIELSFNAGTGLIAATSSPSTRPTICRPRS